jgi:hypothetical protein
MSRRGGKAELDFGSDSFLDIVANIVGILIILIVVAGVRVSKSPVLASFANEALPAEEAPALPVATAPVPAAEEKPEEPAPPVVVDEPPPELVLQAGQLERAIAATSTDAAKASAAVEKWELRGQELERRLAAVSSSLSGFQQALSTSNTTLEELRASLRGAADEVNRMKVHLVEEAHSKPPVKQIEHRLTPMSQLVQGPEVHFRLSENRVSYVPIEQLLDRLREQVERQKSWLLKFNSHQGNVGPVDGFSMNYVVVRQQLSVIEELRSGGRGIMRIGVSEWKIMPEEDLRAETAQEAMQRGSQFYRALMTSVPGTTLTFWVYPDSFHLFRELQAFARDEGFTVAARPLPFGIPIAGSPNGSRSAGQ